MNEPGEKFEVFIFVYNTDKNNSVLYYELVKVFKLTLTAGIFIKPFVRPGKESFISFDIKKQDGLLSLLKPSSL